MEQRAHPNAADNYTTRLRIPEPQQEPLSDTHQLRRLKRTSSYQFGSQFEQLLNNVYDAVLLTESDGRVIKCNPRALELFGYSRDALRRRNILNLISGAAPELLETIRDSLEGNRRVFIEAYCHRKDQSSFPSDITACFFELEDESCKLCFFIRNTTVRKQTEEALQKAQKQLVESALQSGMAEMATGVLHDVGNLINSISVSCELMESTLNDDTLDAMEKTNRLLKECPDLGAYFTSDPKAGKIPAIYEKIRQVLADDHTNLGKEIANLKNKIQTTRDVIATQQHYAKAELFKETVNLNAIIDDALSIVQRNVIRYRLQVERTGVRQPIVRAQKSKIVHIMVNVLQNALDAMANVPESERRLQFESGYGADCVYVKIRDSGEGIPKENLETVFHHGFTTKPAGHGFGLHTCANFMTEMGGKIWAESDGKDTGAAFYLAFPLPSEDTERD